VKLGVLLPTFRPGSEDALEAARVAADAGLDGVFAYDHLWPMGTPERPSLAPFGLLATVASRYDLVVGPLVARVSLVSTEHLVEQYRTLEHFAPGRVIAALGTGDKLSAPENDAYGLASLGADQRRALLEDAWRALHETLPIWFGAGASATNELARSLGAALNVWDAPPDVVKRESTLGETTWAGPAPPDVARHLDALEDSGATWAVFAPQVNVSELKEWRSNHGKSRFH
jgi:alkanesulfonate monooxygenase SsuD/methylene tetrahydromethanopterin reductase-like flavin-dependent oxidoreductase (luciferase family)